MAQAYGALAKFYEVLNADCDCNLWSQYVCKCVKEHAVGKRGADIACGSGVFTRALKKSGLDVFGVDISNEMLSQAQMRSDNIIYILQDMQKLSLLKKVEFITCINDGVNYISQSHIVRFFKRVASNLVTGGYFMFDISSEYKLKEIIGSNIFSEVDEKVSYIWFNYLKQDTVEMDITVFSKEESGLYNRQDESHIQYIHKIDDIIAALNTAGFKFLKAEGHLGEPLEDKSQRINFSAVKL